MKSWMRRVLGSLMIVGAVAGLAVSIFMLIQVWRIRQPASDKVTSTLASLHSTLETSETGLAVVEMAVTNTISATASLENTTLSMAQSVHDTTLLADSISILVEEDLPQTIDDTQTALASAQESAVMVDNVLYALAAVPLIGIEYDPPLPLNVALGQVSDSLDPITASLEGVQDSLQTTNENLLTLEEQIISLQTSISTINDNLAMAQQVVDDFQAQTAVQKELLESAQVAAPRWINIAVWLITFLILWIAITQLGMLMQGFEVFSRKS